MKNLNTKSKYAKAKMKAYYCTTALITLLSSFSNSHAMNEMEDKDAGGHTPYSRTLANVPLDSIPLELQNACESLNSKFIEYAKKLPLRDGRICFEKGYPRQIIIEQNEVRALMGVEMNENRSVAIPLMSEDRDAGWKGHDDEKMISEKRYVVYVKKLFSDRPEEERFAAEKIIPQNYSLERTTLFPTGNPVKENGVPIRQEFQIHRFYKRGNGTEYRKIEPRGMHLSLELEHTKFEHDITEKKSYQIVNCFARDVDNQNIRHNGPQNYKLTNRPFIHENSLERGNDDSNRNLKTSFNINGAFTPDIIDKDAENIISNVRCIKTGWHYDDDNLKMYKIFSIEGTNNSFTSEESATYTLRTYTPQSQSLLNIINNNSVQQTCIINEHYDRGDGTIHNRPLHGKTFDTLLGNLHIKHLKFHHDMARKCSYQEVKIEVTHANIRKTLNPSCRIQSKSYDHVLTIAPWNDDPITHQSLQKADIEIDMQGALDAGNIPDSDKIVEKDKTIASEKHICIATISKLFPGNNWRVPNSGAEYRYPL